MPDLNVSEGKKENNASVVRASWHRHDHYQREFMRHKGAAKGAEKPLADGNKWLW
jgi:hypothetical protein